MSKYMSIPILSQKGLKKTEVSLHNPERKPGARPLPRPISVVSPRGHGSRQRGGSGKRPFSAQTFNRYCRIFSERTLYCTLLYYTILYYTILYHTILYYTILYYTILYYTILYYTVRCDPKSPFILNCQSPPLLESACPDPWGESLPGS